MMNGQAFAWCHHCGGYFPAGQPHMCMGQSFTTYEYQPNPPGTPAGCQPLRQLTEADVRRIVREELAASKGEPEGAQGESNLG